MDSTKTDNEIKVQKKVTEDRNIEDVVDYDELLSSAGELGKYQVLLFLATCPFYFFGVVTYYGQMFLTEVSPKYWCWVPELENLTEAERIKLAIPPDENGRFGISQCYQYVANWTEVLTTGQSADPSWNTVACQNGWEFDPSGIPYPTISSELGWVCDKGSYQATAQAIFFVGSIFGGFIVGWIADRHGRIPALISASMFGCIGGIASTFTQNLIQFSICRFIAGMAYDNTMMMAYLIVLEYVAPRYRSLLSNMAFALFYCFFATVIPWVALACGHWQTFSLATSIPMGLALLTPLFLPESPRWLLSKGRTDEAIGKVLVIGRVNKKIVPTKLIEQFKLSESKKKKEETVSWIEIFKKPKLRKTFILMCFLYMSATIAFDALVRSIGQLNFNFFIMFTLTSFTELPSMVLLAFILDKTGRRLLTAGVMVIACIFTISSVFIGSVAGSVTCALIARFAVNMSYSTGMQWTPEVLPTSVRGSGAAIVHICGFISTMLSPYIVYLQIYVFWLPMVIIGIIALLGGIAALYIPETAGVDMPQTFEEADLLGENQKFWDIPFLRKSNDINKNLDGVINNNFEKEF